MWTRANFMLMSLKSFIVCVLRCSRHWSNILPLNTSQLQHKTRHSIKDAPEQHLRQQFNRANPKSWWGWTKGILALWLSRTALWTVRENRYFKGEIATTLRRNNPTRFVLLRTYISIGSQQKWHLPVFQQRDMDGWFYSQPFRKQSTFLLIFVSLLC